MLGVCACDSSTDGSAGSGGAAGMGGAAGAGGTAGMGGGVDPGCPSTLETLPNWFETPIDTDISGFSSIDASFTFRNDAGLAIDIDGTQLWSVPNVEDVLISASNFPINDVADGAEFTIMLVLDLTGLAASETGFAVRPNAPGLGNLGPDRISFVSAEITCDP